MSTIKLGCTVRDLTTGFTGIACNRTTMLNGCIQFSIQPPSKDGNYPDSISMDENLLEVVDAGVSAKVTPSTFSSPVKLGNKVRDLVTGIEGVAILKSECLNGCALFLVAHKAEDDKKDYEAYVDQCRLVIVDEGITDKLVKPPKAKDGKQPGGPAIRGIPRF